jgi:hypothetical protein
MAAVMLAPIPPEKQHRHKKFQVASCIQLSVTL